MTRRIFLAIPAPEEIPIYMEKLREINHELSEIKWMRNYNLHLTIYFIGNINNEDFDKVTAAVLPVINSHEKFTLELEKICFAPSKKPRMIWARFHRSSSFTKLSNSIHESLKSIIPQNKFHYEEPVPHITLARFHSIEKLGNFNISGSPELSKIHIASCQLWESVPTPKGVRYENIAPTFSLAK